MRYGLTDTSKVRGSRAKGISPIQPGQAGAGSTRLPDNSYVLNADLEAIKQKWPEGYKILTEQGYTAYSQAVADAKTSTAKQASVATSIKAKYAGLSKDQKKPVTPGTFSYGDYGDGTIPAPESFKGVVTLSPKATDIPKAPGFYTYYDSTSKVSSKTKETKTTKTTYVYARLDDGSLIQVDKQTQKSTSPAYWVNPQKQGVVGAKVHMKAVAGQSPPKGYSVYTASEFSEFANRIGGGITHEQRLGATKLSKEMDVPYKQAVGLVSASGYYDPAGIVEIEKGVWGAYTPEVTSALKKLKPFQKADGSYDWTKIVTTKDTQVAIAAAKAFGMGLGALKGVKESIKAYPKLRTALSTGGIDAYSNVFKTMHKELPGGDWVPIDIWEELPKHYQDIGLSKSYNAMDEAIRSDERILATAGFSEVVDGETWYKVSEALSSNDPKVKAAIGALFPSEEVAPTVVAIPAPAEAMSLKPTEWWHRLTPWTEEKGETLGNELAERIEIVKDKLKLTPNEIEEARQAFLHVEDPSILQKLAGSFKISDLWATPTKELTPEQERLLKVIKEKSEELNKLPLAQQWVETKKLETNLGAAAFGQAVTVLPAIRSELKAKGVDLPTPLRITAEVIGGVAIGALILAPLATGQIATELAKTAIVPQKGEHLKEIGVGIADFFISIPSMIAAEPAMASGELVGMFIIGPESALKFLKVTGAKGFPSYIPKRGMGIEYSVVKVPSKIAGKEAIVAAVNEGIKRALRNKSGETIVNIGDGSLRLKIRSTPFSEVVGPALWHATPELAKALQKGIVKGELYTSPHLAVRFAESSASGVPMTKPAILMIHTKAGKVKWRPSTNLYKGAKELEAIYGAARLQRVESLWSRLTLGKLGDFFTTSKGNIIPIYRFMEKGAKVPSISLLDLTIIRIKTIEASLVDLIKGKKGIEIISESKSKMAKRIRKDIKNEVLKGKEIRDAHDIVFRREVRRLVGERPRLIERLYRRSPEIFEEAYRENLAREFRYTMTRTRLTEAPRVKHTSREDRVDIRRERLTITRRRYSERLDREIRRLERLRQTKPRTRVERKRLDLRLDKIKLERENLRKKLQLDLLFRAGDKKVRDYKGAEAWQQGYLRRGKELVGVVKVWVPPFRQEDLETYWADRLPPDVKISKGKPKETVQLIRGTKPSPEAKTADIGAFLVTTKSPTPSPGRAGAITFKKDVKGIRGTSKEALAKLPLGTTLTQLVEGNYNSKIPRSTVNMMLTNKLGDLSSKEIAEVLKSIEPEPVTGEIGALTVGAGVLAVGAEATETTGYTKAEVLRRLPDSKRREVERLLTETVSYAPTRGYPKFTVIKSKLSRKKKKVKSNSPQSIEPVAVSTR